MHVDVEHEPGRLTFTLKPEAGDVATGRELVRHTTSFVVDGDPGQVHPDLLVVSALLCARPWVRRATPFSCSVPASAELAAAVRAGPRLILTNIGTGPARAVPARGRPGLCFSGGTDSVAALVVLPDTTHSYHLRRRAPEGERRATMMDGRAAIQSCEVVRRHGYAVTVVPSDVEYLAHPLGFPHDLTTAVPLLLHADVDQLDAVAWGAPLEATYRLQRGRFRDYVDSPFVAEWGPVFAALGLPVCIPIAGVSEVVTSAIVHRHPLGEAAQSCVRGPRLGRPCGRCPKCARKTLLTAAVSGRWPTDRVLERQWRDTEARQHLLSEPMKVEPVLGHCAHRYLSERGGSALLRLVAAKSGPDPLEWLTRSYEPSLELLPLRYRTEITERLHRFAAAMSIREEAAVRGYDVTVPAPSRAAAQEELQSWMIAHPPRDSWRRAVRKGRREARALLGRRR
ncbi:MAG: DUF6395 domain-containing protein [Ornithinimicrobium sp.]|uniref:DUF6395 domain-containing protein n=1 Tax=Ornithinimicrobium sp. TaxID=1977084 RepID=UPI0026E00789|nr:DUF6395 domain-containing protein [Ornithinimicrobium sp.]MDO5740911.1 DUF6395 domain-containing protein [Ornithinimicrobium sp.]